MSRDGEVPKPTWILRHHAPAGIHALVFSRRSHRVLIAGDAEGQVSINDLRTYRPRAFWRAHEGIILGIVDHVGFIVTHGRDNKVHVWRERTKSAQTQDHSQAQGEQDSIVEVGPAMRRVDMPTPANLLATLPAPECILTLDVNALNYCPLSVLPLEDVGTGKPASKTRTGKEKEGKERDEEGVPPFFLATPHTLEAAWIDVYEMPAKRRVYEALGRPTIIDRSNRPPILMAVHLLRLPHAAQADDREGKGKVAHLLAGYEDGSVCMRELYLDTRTSHEQWRVRLHSEPVMALALSPDLSFALSGSADARLTRYDLTTGPSPKTTVHDTGRQGKASIAIRQDGWVAAVGGWDGNVRMYSTLDFRPLAVLDYHRDTVQAVAFPTHADDAPGGPRTASESSDEDEDDSADEDDSDDDGAEVLACGCRDGRISLWHLTF